MQAVVHAMYQGDRVLAERELEAAYTDLANSDLCADAHRATEYLLTDQRFALMRAFCPRAEQQAEFSRIIAEINTTPLGPCSEVMQCIVLLQISIIGERLGFCELAPPRFHELLSGIPPADRSDMLWHYVATWAFSHWDAGAMAQAYEALVIKPTDFRDQYPYHRANLMYRLITGRATTRDVLAFLKRLEIVNEIYEFEKHILPRVRELGLVDDELAALIVETHQRLEGTT